MFSTGKIALGVFLGIIAAFLVIKAPGWIQDGARQSRRDHAQAIVTRLTPEKLIAACGPPRSDENSAVERKIECLLLDFSFYQGSPVRIQFASSARILDDDEAVLVMTCLNRTGD
jgi:hypothetical protein